MGNVNKIRVGDYIKINRPANGISENAQLWEKQVVGCIFRVMYTDEDIRVYTSESPPNYNSKYYPWYVNQVTIVGNNKRKKYQ